MEVRATIAVLLALAAALAGCSGRQAGQDASSTTPSAVSPSSSVDGNPPTTTLSPRTEKWTALKPGDCLADAPPSDPAVVTVTLVDCSTPHLAETYLRANIPVDTALNDVATEQCNTGFTEYTGQPVGSGRYAITYLIDSDQDRTFNNPYPSTVICLLQDPAGQSLTGSAKA